MSATDLHAERQGDALRLSGRLDFGNAAAALVTVRRALEQGVTQLDLAGLSHADSAALACLLAWRASAAEAGRALRLLAIPESLRALAQVSDVLGLLDPASTVAG